MVVFALIVLMLIMLVWALVLVIPAVDEVADDDMPSGSGSVIASSSYTRTDWKEIHTRKHKSRRRWRKFEEDICRHSFNCNTVRSERKLCDLCNGKVTSQEFMDRYL